MALVEMKPLAAAHFENGERVQEKSWREGEAKGEAEGRGRGPAPR